jgi:hypothetical protein
MMVNTQTHYFVMVLVPASHQIAAIQMNDWNVKLIDGRGADGLAWAK